MASATSHSLTNIISVSDYLINPSVVFEDDNMTRQSFVLGTNYDFMLRELSTILAGWRMTKRKTDFSLLIPRYGYQHFNETVCGLSVGRALSKNISLGIRINYYKMNFIDNQENIFALYPDIGISYKPVDKLLLSMLITNPFTISYRANDQNFYLPFSYNLGLRYSVNNSIDFFMEAEKCYNIPFCFKTAFSWSPFKTLNFNIGYLTEPRMPTAGIGLMIKSIKAAFACQYHSILGFSPSISLTYLILQ